MDFLFFLQGGYKTELGNSTLLRSDTKNCDY